MDRIELSTFRFSVLSDLGPTAPDSAYVHHARWGEVAAAADASLRQLGMDSA